MLKSKEINTSKKNSKTEKNKTTLKIKKSSNEQKNTELSEKQKNSFKKIKESDETEEESKFTKQLSVVKSDFKAIKNSIRELNLKLKLLETTYNHDITKASKTKNKRKINRKPAGFLKPKPIPKKFALFLGIPLDSQLSRPQITSKVWKKLEEKGLRLEDDKRVFKVDKEVSELLKVPMSVNKIKKHDDIKNGFNFRNLQTYIANAMKE